MESVRDILAEMEVDHLPTVVALNKIDLIDDEDDPVERFATTEVAVPISALRGTGIDMLLTAIEASMEQTFESITVLIPYSRGELVSLFHERGQVNSEEHSGEGVFLSGKVPRRLLPFFNQFQIEGR